MFGQFPFLKKLFADSAYAGPPFHDGLADWRLWAIRSNVALGRKPLTKGRHGAE
jgi:hypothetical protein